MTNPIADACERCRKTLPSSEGAFREGVRAACALFMAHSQPVANGRSGSAVLEAMAAELGLLPGHEGDGGAH